MKEVSILKSNSKGVVSDYYLNSSLFPNRDILNKEIELWKSFGDRLSSKEDGELFEKMLNDCYKYAAAINAKGTISNRTIDYGLIAFTTYKMIHWLTKQISEYESLHNNKKEVEESKEEQVELGRENTHDYIRKNERIHYIDDY